MVFLGVFVFWFFVMSVRYSFSGSLFGLYCFSFSADFLLLFDFLFVVSPLSSADFSFTTTCFLIKTNTDMAVCTL